MKLATCSFRRESGWSAPLDPQWDSDSTFVLAFGSPSFRDDPSALDELLAAYPRARVLGCSTAGEIFQDELVDNSLAVAIARFEHSELACARAQVASVEGSEEAGRQIAAQLNRPDLRAVFVLSDGLNVNGSDLVRGFNAVLPDSVVVTGGLAGDGDRFERTWTLDRDGLQAGFVTAVGFYGERLRVGHGSKGGWDLFGPERRVTRSKSNVLYELDDRPALELYKEYLGERASGLPATALLFPLAVRSGKEDTNVLVRTILAVDEEENSMTFAGDVPEGNLAQLMRANFERIVEGASGAALMANQQVAAGKDTLSIAISCVGRRLILGEQAEDEIEAVLDELPTGVGQIGFYSYGEISPFASGKCDLHNQTMTLTAFSED